MRLRDVLVETALPRGYRELIERDRPGFRKALLHAFAAGMGEAGLPSLRSALPGGLS